MTMKVTLAAVGVAAVALGSAYFYLSAERPADAAGELAVLDRYCVDCHNAGEFAGGLALDTIDRRAVHENAAVWEAVVRKLRGRQMPPHGEPRPRPATLDALAAALETELDAAARASPEPGAPLLGRLNRNEYANAIRDLLHVPIDAAALLPADDSSEGFDNVSSVLTVSPAHMQAYVSAAAKISRLAVGDTTISPELVTYRAPRGLVQAERLEQMPFGTRGGLLIEHVFPLDAEYEFRIGRAGGGFGLAALGGDEDIEVTINGERAALLPSRGPRELRVAVGAGPQTVGVSIVRKRAAEGVDDLYAVHAATPGIQSVAIMGPFDAAGPGDTPSRRRIFTCRPAAAAATGATAEAEAANAGTRDQAVGTEPAGTRIAGAREGACAREILTRLATRAFRRSVPPHDPSLATLLEFYEKGRALRGFETGIQYALARLLVDPQFVFRLEAEPEHVASGEIYALDDYALAARLSFFLWSSIPDDALLAVAESGTLSDAAVLEREVRRMLADPKAAALAANFGGQWLMLRQLRTVNPSTPDFDGNLRLAMQRETELLFQSIVREDRSIVELLDAGYTFVDERLARHYGIEHIRGSRFRRIELAPDDPRRGVLGHASLLTLTSAPNRTSPVRRGAWVLDNLLGTPAPPPPEGVETNLEETAGAAPTTLRERLERHRSDPACASCHNIMDGIGFALENFDMIGTWRDRDGAELVDARGELVDGTPLAGPASLREALVARQDSFVTRATEKLLTYALGRKLEPYDMPTVRAVVRAAAGDDYRFSSLVVGIAKSVPFRMKRKAADTQAEG